MNVNQSSEHSNWIQKWKKFKASNFSFDEIKLFDSLMDEFIERGLSIDPVLGPSKFSNQSKGYQISD